MKESKEKLEKQMIESLPTSLISQKLWISSLSIPLRFISSTELWTQPKDMPP
jgi:hypothetical protein